MHNISLITGRNHVMFMIIHLFHATVVFLYKYDDCKDVYRMILWMASASISEHSFVYVSYPMLVEQCNP